MNRHCSACNTIIHINNYKKDRTVCKTCYNKNKRKNNNNTLPLNKNITSYQQPINNTKDNNTNVSTYENHRHVVIGPSNVGKTFYMLKVLEKIDNQRPIHIVTRSPNQYPNYKTNTEITLINKYKGSIVIFDDMLGAKNSSQIDEFFTRGRHEDLDVYYISQSYFGLPRQSIRNNSDRLILFKQTLRDVQSMYYDFGAFVMIYDEFKEMCRVAWRQKYNYLRIDMTKNKNEGKYRIFNVKPHTLIIFLKLNLFKNIFCKQIHSHSFK